MRELRVLLAAVQYFTRVPMPQWVGHDSAQLSGTTRYLPAIGIAIGALAFGVYWVAALALPAVIAVILSIIATVAVTGALHEDGLADTMDGLGGAHTRERALEIMKDPRIGAFGVLSLMLLVGLKIAVLSSPAMTSMFAALVAGHALSRWCAVLIVWRLPYARTDSSTRARPVIERVALTDIVVASVFGLVPLLASGSAAMIAGTVAIATAGSLGAWYRRRLGGYTGDTLGATQQITEVVFYLALLTMLAIWNSR